LGKPLHRDHNKAEESSVAKTNKANPRKFSNPRIPAAAPAKHEVKNLVE
jgi:hypothetical protein